MGIRTDAILQQLSEMTPLLVDVQKSVTQGRLADGSAVRAAQLRDEALQVTQVADVLQQCGLKLNETRAMLQHNTACMESDLIDTKQRFIENLVPLQTAAANVGSMSAELKTNMSNTSSFLASMASTMTDLKVGIKNAADSMVSAISLSEKLSRGVDALGTSVDGVSSRCGWKSVCMI
ncbi:MAG: hypothetical protein EOO65_03720 [Methanosarcinales archaeon]|nr:MAG: hypothetical protein EOO65_03720 [Methanosarcinales archaeon]